MNISVLIGTYGGMEWMELAFLRAAESAGKQTQDVHVLFEKDGTIASVRNALADKATGDWLLFLDADDELAPGYLDAMKRAWEREGDVASDLLLTPAVVQIKKGRPSAPFFFDRGRPLSEDNWLVLGTLVERDLFLRVGGFEDYPHGFEDWSLWYKCQKAGAKIVKVHDAIYRYYWNPQSKHKRGWRDRKWQVETHQRVAAELAAWQPS